MNAAYCCSRNGRCLPLCVCAYVAITTASFAKTSERIDMLSGGNPRGPKEPSIDGGAHWRHLASTIDRTLRSGGSTLGPAGGGAQTPPSRGYAPKFSRTLDTLW